MRTYIQTTWNNADTNDYSGRQQHFKPNGAANIHAYAQEESPKKAKKVKAPDFRTKEEIAEDRLDAKRVQFEKAFEEGIIDFDRYNALLTEWEKARNHLDKRMGIVQDSKEIESKPSRPSIMFSIERATSSFASRHPFSFTIASILFGCGILNIIGYDA